MDRDAVKMAGPAELRTQAGPSPTPGGVPAPAVAQATRAVGYVRVSTREQAEDGGSIAAQRQAIELEVARRGWVLVEMAEDVGVSGKDLNRPGIQRALSLVEGKGRWRRADVLVAAKLDRLSRSVMDFAGLMDRARRAGWSVVVLDVGVDTSSESGELLVNVMAAFAQYERRIISARTRDGLAAKRAAGTLKGPIGRPSALPAEVRERIRLEREAGRSFGVIADGLNVDGVATGQGGVRWWPSTVRAVLSSSGSPAG